jgi:hypothetical protein
MTRNGIAYYKYKDFKKAVVTFQDSLQDVGMGTRVPELEEQDNAMDVDYSDEDGTPKQIGSA